MSKLILWVKANKLISLLIIIILFFIAKDYFKRQISYREPVSYSRESQDVASNSLGFSIPSMGLPSYSSYTSYNKTPGTMQTENRMVVQESNLSLFVNDVDKTKNQILQKTKEFGGFMISSNIDNPQYNGTATISIRIPSGELEKALIFFRSLAIKVVSENLRGDDVTDSYVDIQAQMETLLKTKSKFEDIFDKATLIQDILTVQREIISLQSQIDTLKGRAQYLENNSQMARLTIYLSTDELALPYSPNESWRPQLVLKEAVRSLIKTMRSLANILIWLLVYSIVWIPAVVIVIFVKKRIRQDALDKRV